MEQPEKKPNKFSFKKYYHENEEFRKRHLLKLKEKVQCECGRTIARSNLSSHKKSKLHMKGINPVPIVNDDIINHDIAKDEWLKMFEEKLEILKQLIQNPPKINE